MEIRPFRVDVERFWQWVDRSGYRELSYFDGGKRRCATSKWLEHFVSLELTTPRRGETLVDVASAASPFPDIVRRDLGLDTYRQDLSYPAGVTGDRIGGDAAAMPVPDGFADVITLHCSFEHFEGDADSRFVREAGRVLAKGGRVCILPLYTNRSYSIQSDPASWKSRDVRFESEAVVCLARHWGEQHGRFYDAERFMQRIVPNLGQLRPVVYAVENLAEVAEDCYLKFALVLTRDGERSTPARAPAVELRTQPPPAAGSDVLAAPPGEGDRSFLWGAISPRVEHLLPVRTILELGSAGSPFTRYLRQLCHELILLDPSECDAETWSKVPKAGVDFAFSALALRDCDEELLERCIAQLAGKLTAAGAAFLHHPGPPDRVAAMCRESQLVCATQELVSWGGSELTDCFTVLAAPGAPVARGPYRRRENPRLADELNALEEIAAFRASPAAREDPGGDPRLGLVAFEGAAAYRDWRSRNAERERHARDAEIRFAGSPGKPFEVPALCHVCSRSRDLAVTWDYAFEQGGALTPNWREHLLCRACGLNARMRAVVQILESRLGSTLAGAPWYITEQSTALYRCLRKRYPRVIGSEFLRDGTPSGETNPEGLRHESLTALSFETASLELVVSLDVLEHVPDYEGAIREVQRVLRPGGSFFFTAPFDPESDANVVRARLNPDGSIEHLLPPEYHFDPMSEAGALAYYQFGWELLDAVRRNGFREVVALRCRSLDYGYFGTYHVYFQATKGAFRRGDRP